MGISHIRLHDTFGITDIDNYFQPSRYFNQDLLLPNIPTNLRQKTEQLIADIDQSFLMQQVCKHMT